MVAPAVVVLLPLANTTDRHRITSMSSTFKWLALVPHIAYKYPTDTQQAVPVLLTVR